MFRPSQTLLFRPVPALNKLKIHQPLPLTPRESQQLLNILTTSFRQQLEKEHAGFRVEKDIQPFNQTNDGKPKARRVSISDRKTNAAERHIHSMLTNPLFKNTNASKRDSRQDPMEIFDRAVAKGMMNTRHAAACLQAKKLEIVQSSNPSIRDGMQASGAGLKVLKWLSSSGTANDLRFLKEEPLNSILLEFMVAENLQDFAWTWIRIAFDGIPRIPLMPSYEAIEAKKDALRPLMLLLAAESPYGACLETAYTSLLKAAGLLKALSEKEIRTFLKAPLRKLLNKTMNEHEQHPPSSESTYDAFSHLASLATSDQWYSQRLTAHLSVLHPTKPSADSAVVFLRQVDRLYRAGKFSEVADPSPDQFILLGLHTASLLQETQCYSDAEWVMEFLRRNYPKQLGISAPDSQILMQAKADASSLEILEMLEAA